jgi:hypothetical protein
LVALFSYYQSLTQNRRQVMKYLRRKLVLVPLLLILVACAPPNSDVSLDEVQSLDISSEDVIESLQAEQQSVTTEDDEGATSTEEVEQTSPKNNSATIQEPTVIADPSPTTEADSLPSLDAGNESDPGAPTVSPYTGEIGQLDPDTRPVVKSSTSTSDAQALLSGELYGTDSFNLYLIDKTTGSGTLIGSHGPVGVGIGALAFDSSGTLYGISIAGAPRLFTIDPSSGAASEVGPLGIGFVFEGGLGFDASGQLIGVDQGSASDAKTFTINTSTGAATIVGPFPGQNRDINGIAVEGNTFWAIDRVSNTLGTLDPTTGTYSSIGNTGAPIGDVGGLAVDSIDGTLYAAFSNGSFYSLDKTTGAATLIGSNSANFGLAFAPNNPPVLTVDQSNVTVDEGQTAFNSGTVSDPDGDTVALAASIGSVTDNGDGTWSWSFTTSDGPAESQTVVITGDDGNGGVTTVDFVLTVNNVAPSVDAGPDQTVFRNDTVTVSGTWADPAGILDDPYAWSWDLDGDSTPDSSGSASFGAQPIVETTSFALEGFYTLTFDVTDKDGGFGSDSLLVEVLNRPPDCSNAGPSVDILWPSNHKFVSIDVVGVTDPEGDPIVITIDSIFQDEAVDALGSGNTAPDGQGVGTSTAEVRAERAGGENGRVYHISFTADDGHGGSCSSVALVGVPHDKSAKGAPVDDGPLYDSTSMP